MGHPGIAIQLASGPRSGEVRIRSIVLVLRDIWVIAKDTGPVEPREQKALGERALQTSQES